jgi:transposase
MTIREQDKKQNKLFFSLDDMISQDNIVRLIDVVVKHIISLNPNVYQIRGLNTTGRPAFSPETLFKIYYYGCMNRITTSRRLEQETHRNLELMWLIGNLTPDHKTIADFRKNHKQLIKRFNLDVRKMLKDVLLPESITVATDGTKLKANASKDMLSKSKLKKLLIRFENEFEEYTKKLDLKDIEEETAEEQAKEINSEHAKNIVDLQIKIEELKSTISLMNSMNRNYLSKTDPDCKLMKSRYGMIPGFNAILTAETDYHLILSDYVCDASNDVNQLLPAQEALAEELAIVPEVHLGDAGFCNLDDINSIEADRKTECYTPVPRGAGKDSEITFEYDEVNDCYICSQGKILKLKCRNKKAKNSIVNVYIGVSCKECEKINICTKSKNGRHVSRFWNQEYRDKYKEKSLTEKAKDMSKLRKSTIEHIFGTMKLWLGKIPLSTQGLESANIEIKIFSVAYNLKRLSNIMTLDELVLKLEERKAKILNIFDIFIIFVQNKVFEKSFAVLSTIEYNTVE